MALFCSCGWFIVVIPPALSTGPAVLIPFSLSSGSPVPCSTLRSSPACRGQPHGPCPRALCSCPSPHTLQCFCVWRLLQDPPVGYDCVPVCVVEVGVEDLSRSRIHSPGRPCRYCRISSLQHFPEHIKVTFILRVRVRVC